MVINNNNNSITGTGYCNTINYKAEDINTSDLVPSTSYLEGAKTNITLSQNEKCKIYTSVNINIYTNDTTTVPIDSVKALKYAVYQNTTKISEGVLDSKGEITLATVPLTTTSITYTVYLWIDASISLGTYSNTTYSGYIYATSEQTSTIAPTLTSIIKENAVLDNTSSTYVTSSTGIDFSQISSDTNGKGVYILNSTASDTNPIYYYRGAVDNNNVLFANYCWKIVRTTETGGVKLIYNGTLSSGTCNNTEKSRNIGYSTFNSEFDSPAYVGYMYGSVYQFHTKYLSSNTSAYTYGSDVTYGDGTYTLSNTISSSDWSSIYNTSDGIYNHHYTCFTTGITCSNVYYVYYTNSSYAFYITLESGKKVEDALNDMLDNNTTDSTIKTVIDSWYTNNIKNRKYSAFIEDTIWCNDRSIYALNGWSPNGNVPSSSVWTDNYLIFGTVSRLELNKMPSITCPRDIDKFTVSVSNGNGDLDYPIGLLTADEVMLAGGTYSNNCTYYLCSGNYEWWTSSASYFNAGASYVTTDGSLASKGNLNNDYVTYKHYVRPSISLKSDIKIIGGDGTVDNPYIVNTN